MHQKLCVTDYVSTFCSSVVHAQRMHCVGGTRMLLFAEPNKTCILGSTFLMTGTSAGTVSHTVATPKCFCGRVVYIHIVPQGEPGSEPYMCGTFTCELKMAVSNELHSISQ